MVDHVRYEELTAMAAGGFLSAIESTELREHLAVCAECRRDLQELREVVHSGLPLLPEFSAAFEKVNASPDEGFRQRFLERAQGEGLRFSPSTQKPESRSWFHLAPRLAFASAIACMVLLAVFYGPRISRRLASMMQAENDVNRLARENAAYSAQAAERDQELAVQQKEINDLRRQLGASLKTAESFRRDGQEKGVRLERSTSETAQLLDELEDRDKQLSTAADEIARINQLRATDEASLEAQQIRIKEISDQIRIADATVDMERQLSAAGQDIRQLLMSRQLHVVDVRDIDENGKPSGSFARIFLTQGKSLMFFAFDLNGPRAANAKVRFQVWGEQLGKKGSVRSLGFLTVDDKTQSRWVLEVNNPSALNNVNAVFVTVSTPTNSGNGPRELYAYLGAPNHS